MKRNGIFWVGLLACAAVVPQAMGVSNPGNPYQGIVGRNAFALKPPTPQNPTVTPAPVLPSKVLLQGITTILDRKQVFLKIQPPTPGKEISAVLGEGQREGEIEVLEINNTEGLVKISVSGSPLTLSMEKDAAVPVAGPAIPTAPGVLPQPGVPGLPQPQPAARPALPATTSTFGGATTLPARSMRSQTASAGNTPGYAGSGNFGSGTATAGRAGQNLPVPSLEEQTVMVEVQREITRDAVKAGTMPPLPPTDVTPMMPPTPAPR